MSTIKYAQIPTEILLLPDISNAQKIILGLAYSMPKGLLLANYIIAQLIGKSKSTVNREITELESKKLITIENKQSKYRRIKANTEQIYLIIREQVEAGLLNHFDDLLNHWCASTQSPVINISKGSKDNKSGSAFSSRPPANPMAGDGYTKFGTHPATPDEIALLEQEGIL